MSKPHDKLSADLVNTAMALHKVLPWNTLEPRHVLLLESAESPTPTIVNFPGSLAGVLEIGCHSGQHALSDLQRVILLESTDDLPHRDDSWALAVSFQRLETIAPENRQILNDAGFSARREAIAPFVCGRRNGVRVLHLNRTQLRQFLATLKAIHRIVTSGPLVLADAITARELPTYRVAADGQTIEQSPYTMPPLDVSVTNQLLDVDDLANEASNGTRWFFGEFEPRIRSSQGSGLPRIVCLVIDADTHRVLHFEDASRKQFRACGRALEHALLHPVPEHPTGKPDEITFVDDEDPFRVFGPLLERVGIRALHVERSDTFSASAWKFLREHFDLPPRTLDEIAPDSPPHTIADWKAIERDLNQWMAHTLCHDLDFVQESMIDFFDDVGHGVLLPSDLEPDELTAFYEWLACDDRDLETSKSRVDAWLENEMHPAVRELLRARANSYVSLYRVERIEVQSGRLFLVDVFDASEHEWIDFSIARTARPGLILPARLLPTPIGNLGSLAGPVLDRVAYDRAVGAFAHRGFEFSQSTLRNFPALLGTLFVDRTLGPIR